MVDAFRLRDGFWEVFLNCHWHRFSNLADAVAKLRAGGPREREGEPVNLDKLD